jgi:hypothetical protein
LSYCGVRYTCGARGCKYTYSDTRLPTGDGKQPKPLAIMKALCPECGASLDSSPIATPTDDDYDELGQDIRHVGTGTRSWGGLL